MRLILVLAALAPLAPLRASAQPAPATDKKPLVPAIQRFSLPTGLEASVLPVESPAATVQIWYRAGSKDEPREHRGTAHMFEHMMQKGSAHVRPEGHAQML